MGLKELVKRLFPAHCRHLLTFERGHLSFEDAQKAEAMHPESMEFLRKNGLMEFVPEKNPDAPKPPIHYRTDFNHYECTPEGRRAMNSATYGLFDKIF